MEGALIRRLFSFAAALALLCASSARADDAGPHRGVREVRAAIPVLEAAYARRYDGAAPVTVESVVVDRDDAVATWNAGGTHALAILHYRLARWWIVAQHLVPLCDDARGDLALPPGLAAAVAAHVAIPKAACGKAAPSFPTPAADIASDDGYLASLLLPGRRPELFRGRTPTEAEMVVPGADAIFYFTRDPKPAPFAFPAKSTLEVWCPFVLDPELRYSLTIVGGDPIVGPLDGTLFENTLHFDLPAFAVPAGAELHGEIDGLRRPRT